jgi:hypothetical protein
VSFTIEVATLLLTVGTCCGCDCACVALDAVACTVEGKGKDTQIIRFFGETSRTSWTNQGAMAHPSCALICYKKKSMSNQLKIRGNIQVRIHQQHLVWDQQLLKNSNNVS